MGGIDWTGVSLRAIAAAAFTGPCAVLSGTGGRASRPAAGTGIAA